MVDDAILQKSLTQMNPFLWVSRLTNFHQPGHKLAADEGKHKHTHALRLGNNGTNKRDMPLWSLWVSSFEFTQYSRKNPRKIQTLRAEQQFIKSDVTVATNIILERRNALFDFKGPVCLFKQRSGY